MPAVERFCIGWHASPTRPRRGFGGAVAQGMLPKLLPNARPIPVWQIGAVVGIAVNLRDSHAVQMPSKLACPTLNQ
jgi:hypothetical protein